MLKGGETLFPPQAGFRLCISVICLHEAQSDPPGMICRDVSGGLTLLGWTDMGGFCDGADNGGGELSAGIGIEVDNGCRCDLGLLLLTVFG